MSPPGSSLVCRRISRVARSNPVAYDGPDYEDIFGDGRSADNASGLGSSSSTEDDTVMPDTSDEEDAELSPGEDAEVELHADSSSSKVGESAAKTSCRRVRSLR